MSPGPSMRPSLLDRVAAIRSTRQVAEPSKDARDSTKARRFGSSRQRSGRVTPDHSP